MLEFAQFGREGEEGSESSGYLDGSGFSLHLDINIEIISEDVDKRSKILAQNLVCV